MNNKLYTSIKSELTDPALESNRLYTQIVPEKPSVLAEERIFVYVPKVTNDRAGIARFLTEQFNIVDGEVSIKASYLNTKAEVDRLLNNKVDKTSIVDNLTTNDATKVLSAKQGKVLNDTTAKLSVKNTFTQPQVVPNATENNEAVNLGQLNDTIITALGNIESILDSILGV